MSADLDFSTLDPGAGEPIELHGSSKMLLCRWIHRSSGQPLAKITIVAELASQRVGERGFEVGVQLLAQAFSADGQRVVDGAPETRWQLMSQERFGEWEARAQSCVREGREPIFERFKADADYAKHIETCFPALAAHYQRIIVGDCVDAPDVAGGMIPLRI